MKIAVIGCGVMGSAFARHFAKKHTLLLCDQDPKKSRALSEELKAKFVENIEDAIPEADIVLLGIKPKDLPTVAERSSALFTDKKLVISILAGTSIAVLKKQFPQVPILRIMPNLALTYEEGVIGLVENAALSAEVRKLAESLLEGLGLTFWLPESKIEALTALAASGPAFVFVMIEAMIEAGIYMGFNAKEAQEIVLKTMSGAVTMVKKSGKHPAELKWQIASPGGTTIFGLKEIESEGVRSGIKKAVLAAHHRCLELLKESEQ